MATKSSQSGPPAEPGRGAGDVAQPRQEPPGGAADTSGSGGAAGTSQPDLSADVLRSAVAQGDTGVSAPTALPPPGAAAGLNGVAAMQSDKRVTALWTINEVRNAWAHFDGIGWRKLANNSDSVLMALNILMSHARQTNARVDYDEGTGNTVTQAYVW